MNTREEKKPHREPTHGDRLQTVLWSFRREFLIVGLFSMAVNLLMLTPTLYMLQVFDRVLVSSSAATLGLVSLIVLFLFLMMAFAEWARSMILIRTGVQLDQALSERVFQASFLAHLDPKNSAPSKAFADLTVLRQFITGNGIYAFFDTPWIPLYLAVLYLLHPLLGAVATLFALVQGGVAVVGHRISQRLQTEAGEAQGIAQTFLQSKARNAEVLTSMGMLGRLYELWMERQQRAFTVSKETHRRSESIAALSKFIRYGQQTASLGIAAWLAIQSEISLGAMVAANLMTARALAPIDQLVATWPQFLASKTAFEHLRGLLSLGALDLRIPLSQTPTGRVTVKNLTVRVPLSGKELLQAVDFEVPPGTVTVVLGPSGSGKTTLARSLLGIGPEFVGEVLLDDQPIQQWTRDSLGRYLGYLPQDIDLFSGTVAENIARLGSVDSAKVIEAAQAAGIHQMILRLPNGYETQLGPGGSFLSGGQRQRIGLARALYGDPVVLILDEPNSNLDQEAETALLRVMDELRRKGKTIVMVSHRPGVIQVADRLIILQNGRLLAEGPRDHVLAALQKRRGFSPEAAELSGT